QDQRNTVRGRVRIQPWRKVWGAMGASYGSGLPVELTQNADVSDLEQQYGSRILAQVNFDRGRVRPSFSLDASAGFEQQLHERGKLRIQVDLQNATDRLNVINFAGLFSGTAVAPPRSVAVRLQYEF
ncbi:MAG: TonB-dependent receptor, partial [Acidobacteriota bacterium]|nr:TonB-dependent receptor [Acidobacteriota bacterium]